MKVTHLYHSGFLVELEHTLLLFDYYKGELPPLDEDKTLFVFVSHKHEDHFSPAIWQLSETHPNIWYVLYQDIPAPRSANILLVDSHQQYAWQGLEIETLRSTDEGCAFLVLAEDEQIYHAGDLNWWHWEGEPEEDNAWHDKAFHEELDLIRGRSFDCAFLPLDPRQQNNAWWGFADFLNACPCLHVFPMHYEDNREEMLRYLEQPELKPFLAQIHTDDFWEE